MPASEARAGAPRSLASLSERDPCCARRHTAKRGRATELSRRQQKDGGFPGAPHRVPVCFAVGNLLVRQFWFMGVDRDLIRINPHPQFGRPSELSMKRVSMFTGRKRTGVAASAGEARTPAAVREPGAGVPGTFGFGRVLMVVATSGQRESECGKADATEYRPSGRCSHPNCCWVVRAVVGSGGISAAGWNGDSHRRSSFDVRNPALFHSSSTREKTCEASRHGLFLIVSPRVVCRGREAGKFRRRPRGPARPPPTTSN